MFQKIINTIALKNFFAVELTSAEREIALESVKDKYSKAFRRACIYCLLSILPILFLETQVLISVLIPITMVAGTAWFSISLANMKQKFENFGLELTANLFEAFAISLGLLFMLSAFSLGGEYTHIITDFLPYDNVLRFIAFVIGTVTIGNIVYKIFVGSIQYDINDAMLAGQNEVAEMYFRKSLSILNSVSVSLRSGKSLQVANYYIGVAFYEIFSSIKNTNVNKLKEKAKTLIKTPSVNQEKADQIAIELIESFLSQISSKYNSEKSVQTINDEIGYIQWNQDESQEMSDIRFAIIFDEIGLLIDSYGKTLFKK